LRLQVSDTGIGMDEVGISKAVEPFAQVDGAISRKYEGAGLGLPLAKRLIEAHDGVLRIASEPGRGTTMTLVFPAERVLPA